MEPQEVSGKEFLITMRGYVREDVRAYLLAVAEELFRRDEVISGLRHKLDKAERELAEANRALDDATWQLDQANGQHEVDRATLVKLVGEEASAILSTADGAAERIRFEAQRYAESVRDGLVSTTDHLAELHQNLGQLLVELVAMEPKESDASLPALADEPGPNGEASAPDEISLEDDEHAVPEGDGEVDPSWRWIR